MKRQKFNAIWKNHHYQKFINFKNNARPVVSTIPESDYY